MQTPDVTKAQIVALVQAAIATAVALGAHVAPATQSELLALAGVLGAVIVAADVLIRRGRQKHLANGIVPALIAALQADLEEPVDPPAPTEAKSPVERLIGAAMSAEQDAELATAANGPPAVPGAATAPADAPEAHGPTF